MSAAKNWCFTLNNYTNVDELKLDTMFEHGHFNYLCWGREIGESETPHLQGYVQLKKKLRLSQVRQLLGARGHYEISRGHPHMASEYCRIRVEEFNRQVRKTEILRKRVNLLPVEVLITISTD